MRVSSAKIGIMGISGSRGIRLRIGPSKMPVNMRNIKIGMPVFLKNNSPAKAIMIIMATIAKARDVSIRSLSLKTTLKIDYFCLVQGG